MQNIAEKIKTRAYDLFVERDGKSGSELGDWLNAEKEIGKEFVALNEEKSVFEKPIANIQPTRFVKRAKANF